MADVTDFLRESAVFMAKDRPDVWETPEQAFATLYEWYNELSNMDLTNWSGDASISSADFVLTRRPLDEDADAYELSRLVSGVYIFQDEQTADVRGWTEGSGTLKVGVNLPQVGLDDLD